MEQLLDQMVKEEWDRYGRISTALTFQAGLAGALVSAVAFLTNQSVPLALTAGPVILCVLLGLTLLATGVQICFLAKAWMWYEYAVLPQPDTLVRGRAQIDKYYQRRLTDAEAASIAERVFRKKLVAVKQKIAQDNRAINNVRSNFVHQAKAWFMASFLLLIVTFVWFIILTVGKEKIIDVRVQDQVEVKVMSDQPNSAPDATPDGATPSQPDIPEPDIEFEPEMIKEADFRPSDLEKRTPTEAPNPQD